MDLKDRLKTVMQQRNIKVPELAQLLDIPKARIYAWYRDNSTPKSDDSAKIEQWINKEIFTETVPLDQAFGEIKEQLLNIEARLEVYEATLAGILSKETADFAGKLVGLRKAVSEVVNRRFDELNRKSSDKSVKSIDDLERTAL